MYHRSFNNQSYLVTFLSLMLTAFLPIHVKHQTYFTNNNTIDIRFRTIQQEQCRLQPKRAFGFQHPH
jgi:hypothetical protein